LEIRGKFREGRLERPAAVLFDYGHTLALEETFHSLAGYEALLLRASGNPLGISAAEAAEYNSEMFGYLMDNAHPINLEMHHRIFFRALFEKFRITFDISPLEQELIYWENASPIKPMPGAVEVIDCLNDKGIPTGVVSNMSFSGEALHQRIRSILPRERFRFVMASSDYGWRKPSGFLFAAAAANIGQKPENIWFCGDNTQADIIGASEAGMVPVWVQSPIVCTYRDPAHDLPPDTDYIRIERISELTELIESM